MGRRYSLEAPFGVRSFGERLASAFVAFWLFVATVCGHAASGARWLLEMTLRWPPQPEAARYQVWGSHSREQLHAQLAERPVPVAWVGMVVIYRLIAFLVALAIVVADWLANIAKVPAVIGLPGTSHISLPLDVLAAILFLAMATFYGLLLLELVDAVPHNVHLFPHLRPEVRRAFTITALVGLGLSVLTVGLVYLDGVAILQGIDLPGLSLLIGFLQGVLVTVVAVPALFALVLGVVALLSLGCILAWLLFTGLQYVSLALVGGERRLPPTLRLVGKPCDGISIAVARVSPDGPEVSAADRAGEDASAWL